MRFIFPAAPLFRPLGRKAADAQQQTLGKRVASGNCKQQPVWLADKADGVMQHRRLVMVKQAPPSRAGSP